MYMIEIGKRHSNIGGPWTEKGYRRVLRPLLLLLGLHVVLRGAVRPGLLWFRLPLGRLDGAEVLHLLHQVGPQLLRNVAVVVVISDVGGDVRAQVGRLRK
jgi:hypothetical protein